jgi:hypothetical protein
VEQQIQAQTDHALAQQAGGFAAPTIATIDPQNLARNEPKGQTEPTVAAQVQTFGNPNLWKVLSQTGDGQGNFERTDVCEIRNYGLLMRQIIVHGGTVAVSLVALPSIKIVQATNANGDPLWQGQIPIPDLASRNA